MILHVHAITSPLATILTSAPCNTDKSQIMYFKDSPLTKDVYEGEHCQ